MKRTLLFCSCLLAGALSAAEPEKSPTERLLDVTNSEELTINSAMAAFDGVMDQQAEAMGLPKEALLEIRGEAIKLYKRIFTGPEARKQMIDLYDRHFNEDEIRELIEFYSTPVGRKSLVVMPAIMQDAMKTIMPSVEKEMPAFQQKIAEIAAKYAEAPPAPEADEDE